MAKIYDALQRAEEERKRKVGQGETAVAALDWNDAPGRDGSPQRSPAPFYKRWFSRQTNAVVETTTELNKRRIALLQPDSFVAEQFRTLRGRIDSLASQRPIRTVAMTSANAGDGKSMASINLSLVTAMSVGRTTLLVDCDMRRPKIHRSLGLEPKAGLAEVLLGQVPLEDAIMEVEGLNLHVLAVRDQPPNPSELLASQEMRNLVEDISQRYDRSILDTPAALGLPDAKTISELCDGIVMVVRAFATPKEEVQTALDVLDRRRVLGLVLNGTESHRERYGYY